jgi:membrane protein
LFYLKQIGSILRRTFSVWNEHNAPQVGAALAFYATLSLAPLLILVMAIVAMVFGHSTAEYKIIGAAEGIVGPDGANVVQTMLDSAGKPASGTSTTVIGIIVLLFGASAVFSELQSAMNIIWDVEPKGGSNIAALIKDRLASFGMVLAIGFLLLVSLILSAFLAAAGKFFDGILPVPEFVLSAVNFLISFAGDSLVFGLIFKYVPNTKIAWRDLWIGSLVTAFLFTVGKFLIGLYLGKTGVGSAYGAAGSFIVVIVWVYYSSMIFLFGAEFTHELAVSLQSRSDTR